MKKLFNLLAIAFVLCVPVFASAQQTNQPKEMLTNQQIIEMKNANLSAALIKKKISSTPSRFATDTQSLIELGNKGISSDIIDLMVAKSTSADSSATAPAPSFTKGLSSDKKTYTTSNGVVLKVGKTITMGTPQEKTYGYFTYSEKTIGNSGHLPGEYAKKEFSIIKFTKDSYGIYCLVISTDDGVKVGSITIDTHRFRIAIEAAIDAGEIIVKN